MAEAAYYAHLLYLWMVLFEVDNSYQTCYRNNGDDYSNVSQAWKIALGVLLFFALAGNFMVEFLLLNGPESRSTKVMLTSLSNILAGCLLPVLLVCGLIYLWYLFCIYRSWAALRSSHKISATVAVYFCITQLAFLSANGFSFGKASGRKVLINTFLSNLFVAAFSMLYSMPRPVPRLPPSAVYELSTGDLRDRPDESRDNL